MIDYVREIKRQFRDVYHFLPSGGTTDDPVFDNIPDDVYLMTIEGKVIRIRVEKGKISC